MLPNYIFADIMEKVLGVSPNSSWIGATWQRSHHPDWHSPFPKGKTLTSITHDQHTADYIRLMMQEGMDLPLGEDRAAPLITEV